MYQKIIGKKHTPEDKIIQSKCRGSPKKEIKEFKKEYYKLINNKIILRVKKRTKKSFDWHISLNPKKIEEIREYIGEEL